MHQFLIVRTKRDSRWRHRSQEFLQLRHLLRSPAGKNDGFARLTFDFYLIRGIFFHRAGKPPQGLHLDVMKQTSLVEVRNH